LTFFLHSVEFPREPFDGFSTNSSLLLKSKIDLAISRRLQGFSAQTDQDSARHSSGTIALRPAAPT
jgi:hypothetical protein